jgi:hypothetical protein
MSLTAAALNEFRAAFPRAVHLSGYGNTLFGVLMEVADKPRQALDYFPLSDRVGLHVVDWRPEDGAAAGWPPPECARGGTGRVLFHRLDESCLLTGVVERDEAERVAPSGAARALGCTADGLRDPRPPAALDGKLQLGLY